MNKHSNTTLNWFLVALIILWFFFVAASYFVVHKPFSPLLLAELGATRWLRFGFQLPAIIELLFNLLFIIWYGFVALGCGALLWWWTWRRTAVSLQPVEPYLFSAGAGVGLIGLLVLLFGLLGFLNPVALSLLAVALTLIALVGFRTLPGPPRLWLPGPLRLYAAVALFFVVTTALLPPTNWDGLFYHLTGPRLYLDAGRISGGIDIPHLHFPSLFQMNFLLAMGMRGDVAAQLLHLLFVPLLALLLASMTTHVLGVQSGWLAVGLLLATPMVLSLAAVSYNDLALGFFSVGALYAFLRWVQSEKPPYLLWAGLLAGAAMSLKYTSFMTPLFIGLALLWEVRGRWRTAWRDVLLYGGAAWAVALPWYVKNTFLTGNPFYPFLFGGRFWNEYRAAAYAEAGTGLGWDGLALLRLPYDMTLAIQDASQDGLAGPLFLGLLPLLLMMLWLKRPLRPMRLILLFVLLHYVVWLFGVVNSQALWQVRLFLPGLLALIPPLAWALEASRVWDHPQFSLRSFMNLALGFVLAMLLLTQFWGWLTVQPWAVLSGSETREAFLLRRLGTHYAAMTRLNETLPEDAVVRFLWEPRSYYCDMTCQPDSILDEFGHLVFRAGTAEQTHALLRSEGVTHILLWRTGLDFVLENDSKRFLGDLDTLDALLTKYATRLDPTARDGYELYRLRE